MTIQFSSSTQANLLKITGVGKIVNLALPPSIGQELTEFKVDNADEIY